MRRLTGAYRISLTAMMMAFSLLFFYLGTMLPTGRLVCYFVSSIFIAPLAYEDEVGLSVIAFIGAALLGLLIVPNKLNVIPYVLFFGHYGIGKYFIEKKCGKLLGFLIKFVYFNICFVACYFLVKDLLFSAEALATIPVWIIFVGAQVVFLIYDFAYSLGLDIYFRYIRKRLIK